jgi:hypothetical protein
MTIQEAAQFVHKSEKSVSRWVASGCELDGESILLWSQEKDCRARGAARKLWMEREDRAYRAASSPPRCKTPLIAGYFENATGDDFIDLPCPAPVQGISHVVALLDEIREAFVKRLTELKAIGHAMTIEAAEGDIRKIVTAIQAVEEVVCNFTDEVPRHLWEKHVAFLAAHNRKPANG